jgi:hypothetical protein
MVAVHVELTISSLEQVSFSGVKIGRFEKSFFLGSGYTAPDVTFKRDAAMCARPPIGIGKVTCRSLWLAFFTSDHRMDREGAQVYTRLVVHPQSGSMADARIPPTVTELFANEAVLEIAPRSGMPSRLGLFNQES